MILQGAPLTHDFTGITFNTCEQIFNISVIFQISFCINMILAAIKRSKWPDNVDVSNCYSVELHMDRLQQTDEYFNKQSIMTSISNVHVYDHEKI